MFYSFAPRRSWLSNPPSTVAPSAVPRKTVPLEPQTLTQKASTPCQGRLLAVFSRLQDGMILRPPPVPGGQEGTAGLHPLVRWESLYALSHLRTDKFKSVRGRPRRHALWGHGDPGGWDAIRLEWDGRPGVNRPRAPQ